MSNKLTTTSGGLTIPDSSVSFVDIRMRPEEFPRLNTYTREDAVLNMSKVVLQAFLYRGQQADPQNIQFIASALVDELLDDKDKRGTDKISFAEISRVIRKGVLTEDMFGISVSSLYKLILRYATGDGAKATEDARKKAEEERKKRIEKSAIPTMVGAFASQLLTNNKR